MSENTPASSENLEADGVPGAAADAPPPPPKPGEETLGSTTGADPSLEKDPDDWVTGADPMTEAQKSYLDTLARQAGEEISADLSKAEASEQIDRLRRKTGQAGDA